MEGRARTGNSWVKGFLENKRSWEVVDGFYAKAVRNREILNPLVPADLLRRVEKRAECTHGAGKPKGGRAKKEERTTYKATVGYHGTRYCGYSWQKGKVHTVEAHLQRRLWPELEKQPVLSCSGRTDKGVHSVGQVCSFYSWKDIPLDHLGRALAEPDPESGNELGVYHIEKVPRKFHATFSCFWRYYMYIIPNEEKDISSHHLRLLLAPLEGKELSYDGFARDTPKGKNPNCVLHCCRVTDSSIEVDGKRVDVVLVHLVGNRFLRRMVRIVVSTLVKEAVEIQRSEGDSEWNKMADLAEMEDRTVTQTPAPACGLCLVRVGYEPWEDS
ncbi:pseudouridine synthase [Chloropicon primus]|uniref:tRNA pseudouridine synthase n=1 Tax=Chloropicon primus TaxID=1764295 RepID=A0A5B8MS95_9CHLO|nr:pseudouridine synthase [Chloropicon primus]UPR01506.1 pseudouridine synthase [Chloropicon primus]|eukprot:QDZ22290.1 pseudouridine synthase [Chloropicon primus]